MQQTERAVRQFLEKFAELNAGGTPANVALMFSDTFLAAGPQGTQCIRNEDFARALPKRKEVFDRAGLKKTNLVSVEESMLDGRYALAKTQWRFQFERAGLDSTDVLVNSTYIVDCGAEPWKIVMYLAHQDIFAVLRERGILQD